MSSHVVKALFMGLILVAGAFRPGTSEAAFRGLRSDLLNGGWNLSELPPDGLSFPLTFGGQTFLIDQPTAPVDYSQLFTQTRTGELVVNWCASATCSQFENFPPVDVLAQLVISSAPQDSILLTLNYLCGYQFGVATASGALSTSDCASGSRTDPLEYVYSLDAAGIATLVSGPPGGVAVPEPATAWLLIAGLLGLGTARWWRGGRRALVVARSL